MCWSEPVSIGMTAIGVAAVAVTIHRGRPTVIPLTIGYFTAMEALQVVGYAVVDVCGAPLNQLVAFLSVLHIIFQPFFINAFAMELVEPRPSPRVRIAAYGVCALSAAVMLTQLYPFDWAGSCRPGGTLCGPEVCTVSGEWHIGWTFPFNGLANWIGELAPGLPSAFPTYVLAAFVAPIFYGAWRFVLFHALLGPGLASLLTDDPNELPAIWCLLSIGIVLLSLNPWLWRRVARPSPTTKEI